jgi:hypothetical protein
LRRASHRTHTQSLPARASNQRTACGGHGQAARRAEDVPVCLAGLGHDRCAVSSARVRAYCGAEAPLIPRPAQRVPPRAAPRAQRAQRGCAPPPLPSPCFASQLHASSSCFQLDSRKRSPLRDSEEDEEEESESESEELCRRFFCACTHTKELHQRCTRVHARARARAGCACLAVLLLVLVALPFGFFGALLRLFVALFGLLLLISLFGLLALFALVPLALLALLLRPPRQQRQRQWQWQRKRTRERTRAFLSPPPLAPPAARPSRLARSASSCARNSTAREHRASAQRTAQRSTPQPNSAKKHAQGQRNARCARSSSSATFSCAFAST